jgi:hypothetical protein
MLQWHFVHNESHMKSRVVEPGPLGWDASFQTAEYGILFIFYASCNLLSFWLATFQYLVSGLKELFIFLCSYVLCLFLCLRLALKVSSALSLKRINAVSPLSSLNRETMLQKVQQKRNNSILRYSDWFHSRFVFHYQRYLTPVSAALFEELLKFSCCYGAVDKTWSVEGVYYCSTSCGNYRGILLLLSSYNILSLKVKSIWIRNYWRSSNWGSTSQIVQ